MPFSLDTHVLTVDEKVIHKVDCANPATIHSMWTVFSRCAESLEQGRRLENLSWRLWQKEQLIESEQKLAVAALSNVKNNSHQLPVPIVSDRLHGLPQLSTSVESVADDETVEFTSVSAPLDIARPRIQRQDSSTRTRSGDRHTSSDDFEKMIVSIVKDKAPLSAPTHNPTTNKKPIMASPTKVAEPTENTIHRSGSTTTESQSPSKNSDLHSEESHPSPEMPPRTTTVVRGFTPSPRSHPTKTLQPSFLQQQSTDAISETTPSAAPKMVRPGGRKANFALGASYSSSEAGQSVETRQPVLPALAPKSKNAAQFKLGGSSEEEGSLKSALASRSSAGLSAQKKQASFSNRVITHPPNYDNAIESDSEDDYSAIDDDDDSSDWEDSIEDSGKSSVDDKYFQRVDSKVNLTSRRSLITLGLADSEERAKKLGNYNSQSTPAISRDPQQQRKSNLGASPNDSDDAPLMMKSARQPALNPIKEGSRAQNIPQRQQGMTGGALSPRATRRQMIGHELTDSLRRSLAWERQRAASTYNAHLVRRHTSQDLTNLKQYPEKACMKNTGEDDSAGAFYHYLSKDSDEGYHAKGW